MTNETKHTPGKWQVHERYRQSYAILAYDDGRLQTQKEIAWLGWSSDRHDEENLANAHLIACAPELLKALEETYSSTCQSCEGGCKSRMTNKVLCKTYKYKQLIARAKGENNS